MKKIVLILFVLASITSLAQNAGNTWYFGQGGGLNFNTSPPTPIAGSSIFTNEGCASISNPNTGQCLMYTDGITVWDKNNNPMPGSVTTPLNGDPSSTQSGVIVPKPGSNTIYYVFSTPAQAGSVSLFSSSALCYSIVDLSLNGGNGDLTIVNVPLMDTTTEKIAVVGDCTGSYYWIVGHKWNCDSFYTFKLTSAGLSAPIKSRSGIVHTDPLGIGNNESIGYMKFSSDMKKIGVITYENSNTMQIFDFNATTGIISNPITDVYAFAQGTGDGSYGCSFSPDNSKFYVTYLDGTNGNGIYQYDMNAGSSAAIVASRTIVATSPAIFIGGIQNGPDGKLYIATYGTSTLDVIQNPNNLGAACNYVQAAQAIAGTCTFGLPCIVESFLSGTIPTFIPPANTFNDTVKLCPGDTALALQTIKNNFSIQPTGSYTIAPDSSVVSFYPAGTTTYTIVNFGACGSNDTSYLTVVIVPLPTPDFTFNPLNPDLSNVSITMQNQSNGASNYEWLDNLIIKSTNTDYTILNPGLGKHCYTLNAYNSLGCVNSITKCVEVGDTIVSTFFVPSAFSPNGDGVNDVLKVLGTNIQLNLFSIYNRYGNIIFTTDDITKGWDGTYQGTACDNGVYFYMVQYVDSKDKSRVLGGDVTLIH